MLKVGRLEHANFAAHEFRSLEIEIFIVLQRGKFFGGQQRCARHDDLSTHLLRRAMPDAKNYSAE